MRGRGVLGVALAAAIAVAAQPATSGGAAAGSCAAKHSRTVLANREARVYRVPTSGRKNARREMHACLYATGRDEALDDGGDFFRAFRPPGMALRGHRLAYGISVGAEGDEPPFTNVEMVDLRRPDPNGDGFALTAAGDGGPGDTSKIGSLAIGTHRTIAWIACPDDSAEPVGSNSDDPRPECVRAGYGDQVRTIAGLGKVRVLDDGRDIDPTSLRVRGTRASWIRGGRRHSARLPRR